MFAEKAPFGVQTLYSPTVRAELKKIINGKNFIVTPDENRKVLDQIIGPHESFRVIATMLMMIDERATYSLQVFKILVVFVNGLHQNRFGFVDVARQFVQEFRNILLLNFNDPADIYREQIHYMIQHIYHFLVNNAALPSVEACTTAPVLTKAPQPAVVERSVDFEFDEEPEPPKEEPKEDDEELSVDLNANQNKVTTVPYDPFAQPAPQQEFMNLAPANPFPDPEPEPEPVETFDYKPAPEPEVPEGLDNPRDIYLVSELQLETKPQFDDTIESW